MEFARLAFDRLFAPDRSLALPRPWLLVMSVPLVVVAHLALHHHDPAEAEWRWRGEELSQPQTARLIGNTDAPFPQNVQQKLGWRNARRDGSTKAAWTGSGALGQN